MEGQKPATPVGEFKIPLQLLKEFRTDLRVIPGHLPVAGYIIFDAAMLKSILLSSDAAARTKLAEQIDALSQAGGELVIMAR